MDSSLYEIWHTAPGSPFEPVIGKGSQFFVGFVLLLLGLGLTGGFAFSTYWIGGQPMSSVMAGNTDQPYVDRSLVNLPIYGVPASLAIACVPDSYDQIYLLSLSRPNI